MFAHQILVLVLIGYFWLCVTALWPRELQEKLVNVQTVTFLVTVNDTWDPSGCISTVKTPPLKPNVRYNHSQQIQVGLCDHGPIDFRVSSLNDSINAATIHVVFHSSVVEDADPPACAIGWNGTYLVPRDPRQPDQSLLPGCMTGDSREGYHMTYYWFYVLDWSF